MNIILQFYQNHSVPKEIITSKITDPELLEDVLNTRVVVPSRGIKQDLVKMSAENATEEVKVQAVRSTLANIKFLTAGGSSGAINNP